MKNLKNLLVPSLAVTALLIGGSFAKADPLPLTVTLDVAYEPGAAGDTLTFSGTILNTTGAAVNLDGDNIVLGAPFVTDDGSGTFTGGFWNLAPYFLDAGGTSGDISLFTVYIPTGTALGEYDGTYEIIGDTGVVGSATFDVEVTPEPSSLLLLGSGLVALAMLTTAQGRKAIGLHQR